MLYTVQVHPRGMEREAERVGERDKWIKRESKKRVKRRIGRLEERR